MTSDQRSRIYQTNVSTTPSYQIDMIVNGVLAACVNMAHPIVTARHFGVVDTIV